MNLGTKYFLTLAWVLLLYAVGTWLFFGGFLLKRSVVTQNSTCEERPLHSWAAASGPEGRCDGEGCWMTRRYNRAIILVIDALRFDFVAYNSSIDSAAELPYQNKLKTLHELLVRKPQNTRLYHFWADPPTTTMQRLKGLTTGGLPTFVDVGSNFDSAEITEDNFIDQFVKNNRRIVFMGDDTWTHLFPGRFMKQFDYPSFNVKDLHTVDNGVIEHLIPEMKHKNWDLLIGHFLGVDHCGHRYGPQHPAMADKLVQMDGVLRTVIDELDNDTILFLFGDHGMTGTGDHGGDSRNELDAALLVYSPSPITTSPQQQGHYASVAQVDLVPTISLLMGLPIPFSNLGAVIPDLFTSCTTWNISSRNENTLLRSVESLRLNAQQLHRYLVAYTAETDEFPDVLFSDLSSQLRHLESTLNDTLRTLDISREHSLKQLEVIKLGYERYLQRAKAMCEEIWVNFNLASILLGLTLIAVALLLCIFLYNAISSNGQFTVGVQVMFAATLAVFLLVLFLRFLDLSLGNLAPSLLLGIVTIGVFAVMFVNVLATEPLSWRLTLQGLYSSVTRVGVDTVFSLLSVCLSVAVYFSNSFVVYEDQVTMFLLQSWLCVHLYTITSRLSGQLTDKPLEVTQRQRRHQTSKFDIGRIVTSPGSIAVVLTMAALVCVRLGVNFRGCREEQWLCERSPFLQPLMSLTSTPHKNVRYVLSVVSVVVVVVFVVRWLRYHGNLNGHAPLVMCHRYALPITGVAISLYWAMQTLPRNILENLHGWQVTVFPRIAFILTGTTFLCAIAKPLCLFSPRVPSRDILVGGGSDYIPRAFNHIKYNWRKHLGSSGTEAGRRPPVVYGLATVYSATFLVMTAALVLLLMLVLRDGLAPGIVLQLAAMVLVLEVHASRQRLREMDSGVASSAPWSSVCCWALLASHDFFSTGHQSVFQTIQWEMAYTGFHGDFDANIIPATMLTLNTFAGHILGVFTLPLLIFWPQVRGDVLFYFGMREEEADRKGKRQKGEMRLHEDPAGLRTASLKVILGYLIFSGAKLLAAASAAGLHRRHLMVWKIFTPRIIYEGATFLVISPLLVVVFLIVLRVDRALAKWLDDLVK